MQAAAGLEQKVLALVNPFGSGEMKSPDNIREVQFEKDVKVEQMVNLYLDNYKKINSPTYDSGVSFLLESYPLIKLAPSQINSVMQMIIPKLDKNWGEYDCTGIYISELIEKSIKHGNTHFVLNTGDKILRALGYGLYGGKIVLDILGNAGHYFGRNSKNCHFNIEGNAGSFLGIYSKRCTYHVHGDAGHEFGSRVERCTFNLHGRAGGACGVLARKCTFNFYGDVGHVTAYYANDCTFATPHKEIYDKLLDMVPTEPCPHMNAQPNQVILLK